MKKVLRIILWILAFLLLLQLGSVVVLQSPAVQTYVGKKVIDRLRDKMDADISFSSASIRPFDALVVEDVLVKDRAPSVEGKGMDTLLYVRHLSARFSLMGLLRGESISLRRATLDGGCFHLVIEPDPDYPGRPMTNLQRIFRMKRPEKEPEYHWKNILQGKNIEINQVHYKMENLEGDARYRKRGVVIPPGTIDWNHLDLMLEHLKVSRLSVADDLISCNAKELYIHELETGLRMDNLSARTVRVGKGNVHLDDFSGELTPGSRLVLPSFDMHGTLKKYADFVNEVVLDIVMDEGTCIDMQTISHFAPHIDQMRFRGLVQGRMTGTVADFTLSDIRTQSLNDGFTARVNGRMNGLPDITQTRLDFQLREAGFSLKDLASFIQDWAPKANLNGVKKLARGERFLVSGKVTGPMNALDIDADINSRIGAASADICLENAVDPSRDIRIGGRLDTDNLNVGQILGEKALGPVSLHSLLSATLSGGGGISARLDTLHVTRLNALGYDYGGIRAAGTYSPTDFDIRLSSDDPNLRLKGNALYHETVEKDGQMDGQLILEHANLQKLHLDPRRTSLVEGLHADLNLVREQAHTTGTFVARNLRLKNDSGTYPIGEVKLEIDAADSLHRLQLTSDLLRGTYQGDRPVTAFAGDLKDLVLGQELWALTEDGLPKTYDGGAYQLSLKALKTQGLLAFLLPGLYIENGTQASLNVSRSGQLEARMKGGRLALNDKYVKDASLQLNNRFNSLSGELSAATVSLGGGARIENNRLSLHVDDNQLGLGYSFDNQTDAETRAELYLNGELQRDEKGLGISARILPSNLYYNGQGWSLSSGELHYAGNRLQVERLLAGHEDQQLRVDGAYGKGLADTLTVNLDRFDISLVNTIAGDALPPVNGLATGRALLFSEDAGELGLVAGIVCDSTRIDGKRVGQLQVNSDWDEANKCFRATLHNRLDDKTTLDAKGSLVPATKQVQLALQLDEFEMGYAEPFLTTVFHQFGGKLSGEIGLNGTLKQMHLSSKDLSLKDGLLNVDFTRVPYHVDGPLSLDDKGLHFQNLSVTDEEGGTGTVNGGILLNLAHLDDIRMDTHIRVKDIQAISLPRGVNPVLWGEIYADGRVDITGPLNKLLLQVNAASTKPGFFHLPLGSAKSNTNREMLTFTEPAPVQEADPYEQMMSTKQQTPKPKGDLHFAASIKATPDLQVFLDMDEESSLNARGQGTIELDSRAAQSSFTLGGDYVLTDGSFHFSVMNLVNRNFTIQDGSSVRFNGDVMDTDLDVKGRYTTKASLSNLLPSYDESDSGAGTRRTVHCGIDISGKLKNPVVDFNIDIPDLNPIVQSQVESALNSEDKVQKQFVYLLIAGNFLPTEESGVSTNSSDVLYSNVSSIMSGQLNNIFQKLDIPVDLGLNYQTTQAGQDMFDVAVSTQLFNNRVVVNGTVGNRMMEGGATTNELAGDVDVEVKLNRSGSLRVSLFSHSADQYTYYLDNSQRNGGGIAYQREFNSIVQFFRDMFASRERREAMALEAAQRPPVVLEVQSDGKTTPAHE